jgi:hydrogenase expression/formation protein HypE
VIELALGSGGKDFQDFLRKKILHYFNNSFLNQKDDGAILPKLNGHPVMASDSFVVTPRIFPGGSLGKLAFCGTVNDLAMMGAKPLYLGLNLIIEEGFDMRELEFHLKEISFLSHQYQIPIVTGDTKVVSRGSVDGLFISTTGLGESDKKLPTETITVGDKIIINGSVGDHAMTIFSQREDLGFDSDLESDCMALHEITLGLINKYSGIKFLRDATRGGVSAVLNELAQEYSLSLGIYEDKFSLSPAVLSACELFGFDFLELANEGKFIAVVDENEAEEVIEYLNQNWSQKSSIIGEVTELNSSSVSLKTLLGAQRIVAWPQGEQLPRIC